LPRIVLYVLTYTHFNWCLIQPCFLEYLAKLIMTDTFKFWLKIIFCAFCGNPGSKVAWGVRVQPLLGFDPLTLRSPVRCNDHANPIYDFVSFLWNLPWRCKITKNLVDLLQTINPLWVLLIGLQLSSNPEWLCFLLFNITTKLDTFSHLLANPN